MNFMVSAPDSAGDVHLVLTDAGGFVEEGPAKMINFESAEEAVDAIHAGRVSGIGVVEFLIWREDTAMPNSLVFVDFIRAGHRV